MNFLGKLLGTDKAQDNLLNKDNGLLVRAGGWVDGLGHTDQEQAEDRQAIRDWGIKQLDALSAFKVVQRILAFGAVSMWIIVGLNVLVAIWVEGMAEHVKVMRDSGEVLVSTIQVRQPMLDFAFSDYVFWPVVVVFALYCTGGLLPGKWRS